PAATDVISDSWQEVIIQSGDWEIHVLVPTSWIKSAGMACGSTIELGKFVDLTEMGIPPGIRGRIVSVIHCPKIQSGHGRVVLATVAHLNNFVYNLTVKSERGNLEML